MSIGAQEDPSGEDYSGLEDSAPLVQPGTPAVRTWPLQPHRRTQEIGLLGPKKSKVGALMQLRSSVLSSSRSPNRLAAL